MIVDIGDFFGVGANVVSGGLFGLVGAGLKKVGEIYSEYQRRLARKDEMAHELLLLDKQAQLRTTETENERAIVAMKEAGEIKRRSYDIYNSLTSAHKIVISMVAAMPVVITVVLWAMVGYLIHLIIDTGITIIDGKVLMKKIVDDVLFCAVAVTLWWIGERKSS
jgi:hypothetical protein